MSKVVSNIIANYAGSVWAILMSLAFVPLYIKFMGIESYGLIGFFVSLQGLLGVLDLGMSGALNRELARMSALKSCEQDASDLVRTLEIIYWISGIIIGLALSILSSPISHYWVNSKELATYAVQQAVVIMGVALAMHWPFALYSGGLVGLQRQTLLNLIKGVSATVRGVGAILVLWLISPTVYAFLFWQVVASAVQTLLSAYFLRASLPKPISGRSRFRKRVLLSIWRFSAGISGIFITFVILSNMDKILLSRVLKLDVFGYYVLACAVAGAVNMVVSPIVTAVYPRFCQLVAVGDNEELARTYHLCCQGVSVAIFPLAASLAFFSHVILLAWTRDVTIASSTHTILSILVLSTAFQAVATPPFYLQLAYGWTSLVLYIHLAELAVLPPLLVLLSGKYGAVGAAVVMVILYAASFFAAVKIMHGRLLKDQRNFYYVNDLAMPCFAAFATVFVGRLMMPQGMHVVENICWIATFTFLSAVAATMSAVRVREWVIQTARSIFLLKPAPSAVSGSETH